MSKSVLEPLLSSPELIEHLAELNRYVEQEAERRKRCSMTIGIWERSAVLS